jgi:hypothetical protein
LLPFDFGGIFWMAMFILLAIVGVVLFLVFYFVVMPPISRKLIKAKWSKCAPAFIQSDTGNISLTLSKASLPEGLVKLKNSWYTLIRPNYEDPENNEDSEETKPDNTSKAENSEQEFYKDEDIKEAKKTLLHVPILEGLGKQVFFGYAGTTLLTNLKTVAHANLPLIRELIKRNQSKTQVDALATYARKEGMKMREQESFKILVLALAVALVIGTLGLVFWFLTSGG